MAKSTFYITLSTSDAMAPLVPDMTKMFCHSCPEKGCILTPNYFDCIKWDRYGYFWIWCLKSQHVVFFCFFLLTDNAEVEMLFHPHCFGHQVTNQ